MAGGGGRAVDFSNLEYRYRGDSPVLFLGWKGFKGTAIFPSRTADCGTTFSWFQVIFLYRRLHG